MNIRQKTIDSLDEYYFQQLTKVEDLARILLDKKFDKAEQLWKLQINVVNHQIELQDSIKKAKADKKAITKEISIITKQCPKNWKKQIKELQHNINHLQNILNISRYIFNISRRFGDAIAWLFFDLNHRS
ncbi:MAG: hypothetical protein ACYTBZ_09590 [Planctomycetota bacterium]|jgi:hypothetical protein